MTPRSILSPHAAPPRLKEMPAPMTAAPDTRPASAPILSQLRTAVKLIMPLPAEASARKPMPTTAATGLRFKPRMAARNLLPIVPPNAKRLIPIIAETAMRSPRLTAAGRFTATASQNAKWPIRTTVITKMLFLYPQMPFVLLIIPTARPNVLRGNVTRAINSQVIAAFVRRAAITPLHQSLQTLIIQHQTVRLAASLKQLIPDGHAIPGIINPAVHA